MTDITQNSHEYHADITQLREEIAKLREQGVKLRERVAVLETREAVRAGVPLQQVPIEPRPWWTLPGSAPAVTCVNDPRTFYETPAAFH